MLPVVEALAGSVGVPISVDTMKAEVARRALAAGAALINDVSALRFDDEMVDVVAETGCPGRASCTCRASPRPCRTTRATTTWWTRCSRFLEERMAFALARGVREDQIMVDPGIGFGKTVAHNLALLRRPGPLHRARPARAARRLAQALPRRHPRRRARRRAPSAPWRPRSSACLAGAHVFRVHDVKPNFEALRVALAVLEGAPPA